MRKMKRFAAALAAVAMTAALAVPMTAFAADSTAPTNVPTRTVIMKNAAANEVLTDAEYRAHPLLWVTISGEKYAYTVNPTYRRILQEVLNDMTLGGGNPDDATIVTTLGLLTSTNKQEFADKVYSAIRASMHEQNTTQIASMYPDMKTSVNGQFTKLPQGYYLIAQSKLSETDKRDTYSLAILDTYEYNSTDNSPITVSTKESFPTFTKQLKDINDSSEATLSQWKTSADWDISDDDVIPFRLVASLPTKYSSFNKYKLVFHDDFQKDKLELIENSFTVKVYSSDEKTLKATLLNQDPSVAAVTIPTGADIKYAQTGAEGDTTKNFKDENDKYLSHCDGEDFTITIPDLKKWGNFAAEDKVIVEYKAKLTTTPNFGAAGNWNTAYLEYSTNPYYTGENGENEEDTNGETPKKNVVVFTYKMTVDKIDSNTPTPNDVDGAGFTLYKYNKSVENYVKVKEIGTATGRHQFVFEGLDDGDYKLVESTVPDGYSKCDDIYFTVSATHSDDDNSLTELKAVKKSGTSGEFANYDSGELKVTGDDLKAGNIIGKVVNTSGTKLPDTGSIGTKLFFLFGGITATAGAIFLITKKRMDKEEA